jgi:hypothetical protein
MRIAIRNKQASGTVDEEDVRTFPSRTGWSYFHHPNVLSGAGLNGGLRVTRTGPHRSSEICWRSFIPSANTVKTDGSNRDGRESRIEHTGSVHNTC